MLNVIKEQKGAVLVIRLSGPIDEHANLDSLFGEPRGEIELHCKDVSRINSIGVKAWIRYLQAAAGKQAKVRLVECSTPLVEQMNMISNFCGGATVESIAVPFACTSCGAELSGIFRTADLKRIQFKVPDAKCAKCQGRAVFDDFPEEYFSFLSK